MTVERTTLTVRAVQHNGTTLQATDCELRWGYSLGHVHSATRVAVASLGDMAIDYLDRFELASSAIAELLYTSVEQPSERDLVHAGRHAIWAHVNERIRHHGLTKSVGGGERSRFAAYWADAHRTPSPEDALVDRRALTQILPLLTQREREGLGALATYGDLAEAAAAMGYTYKAFGRLISRARRKFFAAWHEHETPSGQWARNSRDRVVSTIDNRPTVAVSAMTAMRKRRARAARAMASA